MTAGFSVATVFRLTTIDGDPKMNNLHGLIRVVSKRREPGAVLARQDELVIDGDRSNPRLGNRHVLPSGAHEDGAYRARVIEAYRLDFIADIARNGPMSQAVDEIVAHLRAGRNVALRCWCAPRDCHLDLIAQEARNRLACEAVEVSSAAPDHYSELEV